MVSGKCNRKQLDDFISGQLEVDDKLAVLYHLEECIECWEKVYDSTKAQHPHYYKSKSRRVKISERELVRLGETEREAQEIFEVA